MVCLKIEVASSFMYGLSVSVRIAVGFMLSTRFCWANLISHVGYSSAFLSKGVGSTL